jgi:hypothetical protein
MAARRSRVRIRLGDIIEVPTPNGLSYVQYTQKHPIMGHPIRVLPGTHESRPADLAALADSHELYYAFMFLAEAIRKEDVQIVGHAEVPIRNRPFPLFRAKGLGSAWWLWDGDREWKVGDLTEDTRVLPIRAIWDATMLIHRITEGWHPVHEA